MKKCIILTAIIAALILLLICCFWLVPNFGTNHFSNEPDLQLEDMKELPQPTLTSSPQASPQPNPSAEPEEPTSADPIEMPVKRDPKKQTNNYVFTLDIQGKKVNVADGVDEATLKKTPGWLTTSAMPGEDGTCVVYGHRNRKHLRSLEKVKIGDEITVLSESENFTYEVVSIQVLESDESITLPASDGKSLVLSTCYPFRYSGKAPQKCKFFCEIKN